MNPFELLYSLGVMYNYGDFKSSLSKNSWTTTAGRSSFTPGYEYRSSSVTPKGETRVLSSTGYLPSNPGPSFHSSYGNFGGGRAEAFGGVRTSHYASPSVELMRKSYDGGLSRTVGGGYSEGYVSNVIPGRPSVVDVRTGPPTVVDVIQGQPSVIDVRELEPYVTQEKVFEGETRIVSEHESRHQRTFIDKSVRSNKPNIETIAREKVIQVIKERPVPVEKFVDVRVDVMVDIPIERTIEREQIHEIVVEKPIEKIIEIPIEQVIEIPVEKIIEKPIEMKRYVDRHYETFVERPYEVLRENIIMRDNIIDVDERDVGLYGGAQRLPTEVFYQHNERIVERPVYVDNVIQMDRIIERPRHIEIPREVTREVRVPRMIERPVPVERTVIQEVEVPVENTIFQPVDIVIEQPRYIENIIEMPVPIERVVEYEVTVPIEHLVEVPVYIENLIEMRVDLTHEVPVPREELVEVPYENYYQTELKVERVVARPVEKVLRKSIPVIRRVEVPVNTYVDKLVPRGVETTVEKRVNRYIEKPVEHVVERPVFVERLVERPREVEKIVRVPVETVKEVLRTVERVVDKPVYYDTVIEKQVEVLVEKIVEVPVEKIIEVPVKIQVERPVVNEVTMEDELFIETEVPVFAHGEANEVMEEFEDQELQEEINFRKRELAEVERENARLRNQSESIKSDLTVVRNIAGNPELQENFSLQARLTEAVSRLRQLEELHRGLVASRSRARRVVETTLNKDPRVETLKNKINALLGENERLVQQVSTQGQTVLNSLPRNMRY